MSPQLLQTLVLGVLVLAFCAALPAASAARPGSALAVPSRIALVNAGLDAAAALVIARQLLPWGQLPPLLWLLPLALAALGVALAVHRGAALPWHRPGRPAWRSWAGLAANAALLGVVAGVLLLP